VPQAQAQAARSRYAAKTCSSIELVDSTKVLRAASQMAISNSRYLIRSSKERSQPCERRG
jgi:hypothetical protein